jgi:hypothetical protein
MSLREQFLNKNIFFQNALGYLVIVIIVFFLNAGVVTHDRRIGSRYVHKRYVKGTYVHKGIKGM